MIIEEYMESKLIYCGLLYCVNLVHEHLLEQSV
jgi:hypothetical protein